MPVFLTMRCFPIFNDAIFGVRRQLFEVWSWWHLRWFVVPISPKIILKLNHANYDGFSNVFSFSQDVFNFLRMLSGNHICFIMFSDAFRCSQSNGSLWQCFFSFSGKASLKFTISIHSPNDNRTVLGIFRDWKIYISSKSYCRHRQYVGIFLFSWSGFGNENLYSIDSGSHIRTTLKVDENNFWWILWKETLLSIFLESTAM